MPNMSYCRFQNTLNDLRDCANHIDDTLGSEEHNAREMLIEVCQDILSEYDEGNIPDEPNDLDESE